MSPRTNADNVRRMLDALDGLFTPEERLELLRRRQDEDAQQRDDESALDEASSEP